jgi:hypothetical protein
MFELMSDSDARLHVVLAGTSADLRALGELGKLGADLRRFASKRQRCQPPQPHDSPRARNRLSPLKEKTTDLELSDFS